MMGFHLFKDHLYLWSKTNKRAGTMINIKDKVLVLTDSRSFENPGSKKFLIAPEVVLYIKEMLLVLTLDAHSSFR